MRWYGSRERPVHRGSRARAVRGGIFPSSPEIQKEIIYPRHFVLCYFTLLCFS